MEKIIGFWERGFYTELLLIIVLIITFAIALLNRNKITGTRFFPVYFASFLLLFIVEYIYHVFFPFNRRIGLILDNVANFTVTTIELLAFLYFFYTNITLKLIKRVIQVITALTILTFPMVFTKLLSLKTLHTLYLIESLILLSLGIIYFVEMFRSTPHLRISNLSSFWISSGIIFYSVGTFPTTIITDYVFNLDYQLYANIYSIINLFYVFLYLLIIRTYKCTSTNSTFSDS